MEKEKYRLEDFELYKKAREYRYNVSEAIFLCVPSGITSNVRMLCRRSASFIRITRTSSERVSSIFLKFSACKEEVWSKTPEILVNPSIILTTFFPNKSWMSSRVRSVSSTTSCRRAHTTEVVPSPISSTAIRATAMGW